jgi:phosphate transport system permease protein
MAAALLVILLRAALPAIRTFGPKFLVTSDWRPNEREVPKRDSRGKIVTEGGEMVTETLPASFGALPVAYGTAVSSALALLFAVPMSIGAALFLVRIAPAWLRGGVSFLIEFLATIPSIAYGMWGLFVLAPFLQSRVEPGIQSLLEQVPGFHWLFFDRQGRPLALTGRDMFCGGLILAIMIIPIITAIARDVLRAVPRGQIEGSLALGATWWQSVWLMLEYSKSGLFGAVMLGLARAAGETMAVTMVIGNNNQIQPSFFAPAQTMSSLLANEFSEAETAIHRAALVEVALILLVLSLGFNMLARRFVVGSSMRPAQAA